MRRTRRQRLENIQIIKSSEIGLKKKEPKEDKEGFVQQK